MVAGVMNTRWLVILVAFAAISLAVGCGAPKHAGYCAKECTVTADCCPVGVTNCPGDYPQNYECVDGLCKAPHCTKDADCALFGAGFICTPWAIGAGCAFPACTLDSDCTSPGATCASTLPDGRKVCSVTVPKCTPGSCPGRLTCLSGGRCGCTQDSDCGTSATVHCVGGTCGCAGDQDCGANGVCTDDPAFRYPSAAAAGTP